jgi:hypothetical protein
MTEPPPEDFGDHSADLDESKRPDLEAIVSSSTIFLRNWTTDNDVLEVLEAIDPLAVHFG